MSGGVFNAFKDAILILEEVKRLGENIRKLIERVEKLEEKIRDLDVERAVSATRDATFRERMEAATRVAAAESHVHLIERIVRLEQAVMTAQRDGSFPRVSDHRNDRP